MYSDTIRKYATAVPRYTSYPTAPHFSPRIGELQYVDWLAQLKPGTRLSLYAHIPFCHHLCWYCGCNTKATRKYPPVAHYLDYLRREIANLSAIVPNQHAVGHLHWGGGSPNILSPRDIEALAGEFFARFKADVNMEFAVEIDPRYLTIEQIGAFASVGVNRVSVGVQDFDSAVQAAIGRRQSFDSKKSSLSRPTASRRLGTRTCQHACPSNA